MSTQQQIDDPGQWRVGDVATYEYTESYPITGRLWFNRSDGGLYLGPQIVRDAAGLVPVTRIIVTRTGEPIPEPTVPWALVRFADDSTALRDEGIDFPWLMSESATWTSWGDVVSTHGAPVAVSLPHWSDEVDGLRARVEQLAAEWERRAYEYTSSVVDLSYQIIAAELRGHATRLRALLAEGGEA